MRKIKSLRGSASQVHVLYTSEVLLASWAGCNSFCSRFLKSTRVILTYFFASLWFLMPGFKLTLFGFSFKSSVYKQRETQRTDILSFRNFFLALLACDLSACSSNYLKAKQKRPWFYSLPS